MMQNRRLPFFVCLLAGAACVLVLTTVRSGNKWRVYKTLIGETLTEALCRELAVRDTGNVPVAVDMNAASGWLDELPDTVKGCIRTAEGSLNYKVPREKYRNNVCWDRSVSVYHTYLMMGCPVSAGSLYHRWQQIVREESADAAVVGLRLRLPGRDEAFCLPDSLTLARADSICIRYAGRYCELEAVAFSSVGRYGLLGWADWLFAVFWGSVFFLVSYFLLKLFYWRRPLCGQGNAELVSCEPLADSAEAHEAEGESSGVDKDRVCIRLEDGCLYGPNGHVRLTNKENMLMEQILGSADGKQVEKMALCRSLWPKVPADSAVNSLRATVSRLRIKLQKIGFDIRSLGDCYCLVWLDERDEHAENQD